MKIDSIICETYTGVLFDNAIMVCVRLLDGGYADYLFTSEGEPMDLEGSIAQSITDYYNKQFNNIQILDK